MCTAMILVPFLLASSTVISLSKGQDVSSLVEASNSLAIEIHRNIAAGEGGNILMSPLGLSINNGLHCNGPKDKTVEEIRTTLGRIREDSRSNGYLLYIATAVFLQRGSFILPQYRYGTLPNYNAIIHEVDFQNRGTEAVKAINDWVKSQTNNKIEKMLDNVDPDTNEIFLNAVYFKETWNTAFDPKHTREDVFYNNGFISQQTKVEMMHLVAEVRYIHFAGARMIEIPFKDEHLSMYVFLPDDLRGAYKYEIMYTPTEAITLFMNGAVKGYVDLSIPKFKIEYQTDLSSGNAMDILFQNNDCQRTLSIADPRLKSRSVHKVVFEIDEEGSETSEITGAGVNIGWQNPLPVFVVNHPFLFLIYNKRDGETYLIGRVSQL